ncbi:MAG TPA: hypothetical protein VNI57_15500, partial [Candidatus Saccharimonadales bacterium]|nr:hypothetical protein [Candidatus Saccharimonadales bacterium]
SLSIRPMAPTRRFAGADVDPQAAGKELEATRILAGHFLPEAGNLQVTVEVIDTKANSLVWRDSVTAPADDLIGLRERLSESLRSGLLPLLGVAHAPAAGTTRPTNPEAYALYLRAAALDSDPEPTKQAIALLDQAVSLDPDFAPAWSELGRRLFHDGYYSDGGQAAFDRGKKSVERALQLDPGLRQAAGLLILRKVEEHDLAGALDEVDALVRSSPDSAQALFAQSYVLRYAGLIDESGRACDKALALDPRNREWRSCALTFIQQGNYAHARDFTGLDSTSQWSRNVDSLILQHQGQREQALEMLDSITEPPMEAFVSAQRACVEGSTPPPPELVSKLVEGTLKISDPEPKYWIAVRLASCGLDDAVLRLLRAAVEGNFLCYPAMDHEPSFERIRDRPEFAAIRKTAIEKQKEIVAKR